MNKIEEEMFVAIHGFEPRRIEPEDKEGLIFRDQLEEEAKAAALVAIDWIEKALSYGYHAAKDEAKGIRSNGYATRFYNQYGIYTS